jgi:TonB family protein
MEQLTDPTASSLAAIARRRYADSPALWSLVIFGSLVLHLALILGSNWFNLQVSLAPLEATDVMPMELIDIVPQSAELVEPSIASEPQSVDEEQSADRSSISIANAEAASPQPELPQQSTAPQVETVTPRSLAPPSPTITPSAFRNPGDRPSPSTPDSPGTSPPVSPTPAPQSTPAPGTPAPPPSASPTPISPSPGATTPPTGGAEDLPVVPVSGVPGGDRLPTGITASLTYRSEPVLINGNARDVPEESAVPNQETRNFSSDLTGGVSGTDSVGDTASCELKPTVLPNLGSGQPVSIRVVVDEQGKVLDTNLVATSQNGDYDQLAECLIKQWEFTPAMSGGLPIFSNDLVVDITLDQN